MLPIAGVLFESASGWMKKEKAIRLVSLCGVPCWLVYNVISGAYASAIGSVLALISIISALIRYELLEKKIKERANAQD